ncbi:hypothetical protein ES703_06898 [subsurface metagenome]
MRIGTYVLLAIVLIESSILMVKADFIDDYENENYIATKERIIRNPILNAMELNYSITKKNGEYEKDGFFITIKILSNLNGSSLVLLTNSTLNRGSIKVQFSSDNFTWVDHNNQKGHDSLEEGFGSIDLRDLNFTSIYLRYDFKRGKGKMTPRLYQTIIIWTDREEEEVPTSDDYSIIFLAIGLILVLVIAFLYDKPR